MITYKSNEFSIEISPNELRVHQCYEEEGWQCIELQAHQVEAFCQALKAQAKEAAKLGKEFDKHYEEARSERVSDRDRNLESPST